MLMALPPVTAVYENNWIRSRILPYENGGK